MNSTRQSIFPTMSKQITRPSRRMPAPGLLLACLALISSSLQPAARASARVAVPQSEPQAALTLLQPSSDCEPLAHGVMVTQTLSFMGDSDCFAFTGQQNDMINVYVANDTDAGQRRLTLSLRNADGQSLTTASSLTTGSNVEKRQFRLPADGAYFAVISGISDTTGPYRLWLSKLSQNASAISDGQALRREIDHPGDGELYTFNGRAGDRVTLYVDNLMLTGTRRLALTVYRPTAATSWKYATSTLAGWDVDGRGYNLPENGTYIVVVEGFADSTGSYQLGYSNIGQDITFIKDGESFAQHIAFPGDEDGFAFMGCASDIITIFGRNMTTSGSRRLALTLLKPDGSIAASQSSLSAGSDVQIKDLTLSASGQYRIIFGGIQDTTGPYTGTLSYLDLPPACGSVTQPDRYEPNDTCLTATWLPTYTIPPWTANLHTSTDVDFYSLVITQPGTTLQATLNQPGQDYDLVLYPACQNPMPEPVQAGRARGTGTESIIYNIGATSATTYYLKVEGFDGAYAELPYDLQIELTLDSREPDNTCDTATIVSPTAPASSYLSYAGDVDFFKVRVDQPFSTLRARVQHPDQDYDLTLYKGCPTSAGLPRHTGQTRQTGEERLNFNIGADPGWYYLMVNGLNNASSYIPYTLSVAIEPLAAQSYGSLILTHRARLQARFSAQAEQDLYDKLIALAGQPSVSGLIVDIGANPAASDAYLAWDADPASPALANAVAQAIKTLIGEQLSLYPGIRYLVIAGDDHIVPFYRTLITPTTPGSSQTWRDESAYLSLFAGPWNTADPTVEALRGNYTLTDDYYAADEGIDRRGHTVHVPGRGLGRLVETPAEMGAVVDAFIAMGGHQTAARGLAAGASFPVNITQWICDRFSASGLTAICFANDSWNANTLRSAWLDTPQTQELVSINADTQHAQITPPAGGAETAQDALSASAPRSGVLLYSLGNHMGLNVAPGNPGELDWPQALAGKGASLVGNTGWGYGLAQGTGLSDAMIERFTRLLVTGDGATLGDALLYAKRAYYLGAARFDHFDAKVLAGLVLYGLPMFSINTAAAGVYGASAHMAGAAQTTDAPTPATSPQVERGGEIMVEQQVIRFGSPVTQTTPTGQYFTLDGQSGAPDGQPLQPRHIVSTYAISRPIHGAVLVEATYRDVAGINPVIAVAVNPGAAPISEPAFQSTHWTPQTLFNIQTARGMFDGGLAQDVVIDAGQFKGTSSLGAQRLYSSVTAWLYRADDSDWTPPEIGCILASPTLTGTQMRVTADDDSEIYGVLVAYTTNAGQWQSVDLSQASNGAWAGTVPAPMAVLLVQVVDKAGNVTSQYLSESSTARSTCASFLPRAIR